MVTDVEREHVMNGNLDDLVEHQRRMDEERDAQVLYVGMWVHRWVYGCHVGAIGGCHRGY